MRRLHAHTQQKARKIIHSTARSHTAYEMRAYIVEEARAEVEASHAAAGLTVYELQQQKAQALNCIIKYSAHTHAKAESLRVMSIINVRNALKSYTAAILELSKRIKKNF